MRLRDLLPPWLRKLLDALAPREHVFTRTLVFDGGRRELGCVSREMAFAEAEAALPPSTSYMIVTFTQGDPVPEREYCRTPPKETPS